MIQARTFGALLALGALTALPGCSMLGGGMGGGQSSQAATSQYTAPAATRTAEARQQAPVEQPITKRMIRRVQANLKHDGLYRGRIDGVWGPKSEHAAREFQEHNHMNPTGKIDLPMLQAMNLGSGNEQYGEANGGMGQNGNAGPNGSQQYGEANTGPNNGQDSNGKISPSRNFTTGGQTNAGTAHASNMPYQPNNTAPNAAGGAAGNGANGPSGNTGTMNNGMDNGAAPASGTTQPQH
ncbi:MAG TPA: peptidoglycan-binding domain-containing protein [Acetobacteraceae bacterium]|nr:peptidoglycan-binding domain-containing protein [Acetobacteraceae bacterium]